MADTQFDMTLMKQIREHAEHLKNLHGARNSMYDDMEEMLLMQWDDEERVKRTMENVKLTKHPGPRNALLGAIRLMIAADPVWSVPFDASQTGASRQSEKIEKMADAIWDAAGRVRHDPVHYDVVLSMLTFAEVHIAVTRTADLVEHARGASKAAEAKAEEIAAVTPYVFDVWDPRTGYPELGPYGLTAFYREVTTTSGQVMDEFGDAASRLLKEKRKRYDQVTLCHYWDYENRITWLKGYEAPLVQEAHNLPFIPVEVQLGEGSRLFERPEHQRWPFLYTLWRSDLWSRQNLILTVLYTMVFGIGANPMFLYKANQPGKTLNVDYSTPGGVATIERDEDFSPMLKQVIDPSLLHSQDVANQLVSESTIYAQTLGEPLGGSAPFSMVALLHQAGRLPLLVPQRKASWAISGAMKMALLWMKQDSRRASAGYGSKYTELDASDIPDRFELEAKLDIALPQDRLQMANIANLISGGDDPLTSKEWARENILNIGQSNEMQRAIWGEQASQLQFQRYMADQMQALQQQMQQMQQPPGLPMQGPPGVEGLPPEMAQYGQGPPIMPPTEEGL